MWSRRHLKMVRMMLTKQTDATAGPPDGDTFLVGLFETFAYSSLLLVGRASLFLMWSLRRKRSVENMSTLDKQWILRLIYSQVGLKFCSLDHYYWHCEDSVIFVGELYYCRSENIVWLYLCTAVSWQQKTISFHVPLPLATLETHLVYLFDRVLIYCGVGCWILWRGK